MLSTRFLPLGESDNSDRLPDAIISRNTVIVSAAGVMFTALYRIMEIVGFDKIDLLIHLLNNIIGSDKIDLLDKISF